MNKLRPSAYDREENTESLRFRLGVRLLDYVTRFMGIQSMASFTRGLGDDKFTVVLSDEIVDYWSARGESTFDQIYVVKHTETGEIFGGFLFWKHARRAAKALSQDNEEYHFCEHIHDENAERIIVAEEYVDEVEPNLTVDKIQVDNEFTWEDWADCSSTISADNIRTFSEFKSQHDLSEDAEPNYPYR